LAFISRIADPHLGREEHLLAHAETGDNVADHRFAAAIHRRGVDHPAAGSDEALHHLAQRPARSLVLADIEDRPGAEADDRHRLARGWDRAGDHRGFSHGLTAPELRQQRGAREAGEKLAAAHFYPIIARNARRDAAIPFRRELTRNEIASLRPQRRVLG
jgi:hypothetical protein